MRKAALVVGASRGIGRQIALSLSKNRYGVGVASKTETSTETLPGSIYTVAAEIEAEGGRAEPMVCNTRSEEDIKEAVQKCIKEFGRLDVAVYNAGSITWDKVINTKTKKYDLMNEVNARGAYIMVQEVLPHFLEQKSGKIILVSPPIYNRFFKGKTPYSMSKVAMTVLVHGLANELQGTGVSISALWPATVIRSHVTDKLKVPLKLMRTPDIFADAVVKIAGDPTEKLNGQALIDEDYLRTTGVSDFSMYRCDSDHEPSRMMPQRFPSLLVEEEDQNVPLSAAQENTNSDINSKL
ncbi:hydroxysteroid dehydrogenase-like protein 2 [Pecten maximus]|uniref:hydroxysteroid dehydrogenase-like protein 2 n=1 Tax=Pecten maximus TaxID=6579 RepID=UPI0014587D96|nr:hydroxysteroid dehydrogenase-like protein 2 [Pecten maximus]XP_033755447.1 hydroxysteroid dehydrogenase-like protein 2 [Pecten maximus]XP_033755448.1 hydroxysteroid dehydrogenase-like protein 2 [Pecten maximus]